ncbi:ABC transporter ATP-binding protein [Paenibacillus pasadenensis]|uniref:Lipid A export ATP-binding/permease protein MsbA n=1 Tax=Paenibacillus pasadenensis TaxID=217090 RepID=A0A2N5N6K3_9BACL|nr:ABC transporter ATP-binding protein [Paenibacillus pasadenensis]PLT45962.1 Lipid A export ATP-binding/permease protein MsbA [Paenibacillus pasadenensis]
MKTSTALRRLGAYLLQSRRLLLAIGVSTLGASGCALAAPYLTGQALDALIGGSGGFAAICLTLAAVYLLGSLAGWLQARLLAAVTQRTVWQLRGELFARMQRLPVGFYEQRSHGELMSRTTNDLDNVSNSLNQSLVQLISSVISIVGSLALMLWLQPLLTLVAVSTVPLLYGVARLVARTTRSQFKLQQVELAEANSRIEETVTGRHVVTLFHQEERAAAEFSAVNKRLRAAGTRAQIYSGLMGPSMNLLGHLNYLLIAAAGGWLASRELASVGLVVSFLGYSRQFSGPVNELANQYNLIQAGVAGAERIFETLDTEPERSAAERCERPPVLQGEVEFREVGFGYGAGAAVLRDVSFAVPAGTMTALVGPTGAGKSTIVSLLARFHDPTSGTISIGGVDLASLHRDDVRSRIGIVLQETQLFSGTVRENIRYGRLDASDAEVEAAARAAQAHRFIQKLPDRYDTRLAPEGGNLSLGQRQLISIARTLLADPDVLLLDEATSSVDTLAELEIQKAMASLMKGRTSIVVAHRLGTIRRADQILVLHEGRIEQRGTHDELMRAGGRYRELHRHQFEERQVSQH